MDDRDRSIIRQVAFKGAVELIPNEVTDAKHIVASVKWMTDQFEKIILNENLPKV